MIDKITAKIRKYPFQTGIIIGCLLLLILSGFINLFQDNGRTLTDNAEIIQEDYLRMTINEFGRGGDGQLAAWRYDHMGRAGDKTLKLMAKDSTIDPQLLAAFAEAVGKKNVLSSAGITTEPEKVTGTPAAPKKGISGFGKTVLIFLGLVVLSAAGLYAASLVRTRKKQQKRASFTPGFDDEPLNVITPEKARMAGSGAPDTLFDLDKLFPQKDGAAAGNNASEGLTGIADLKEPAEMPIDDDLDFGIDADAITVKENENLLSEIFVPMTEPEDKPEPLTDTVAENAEEEAAPAVKEAEPEPEKPVSAAADDEPEESAEEPTIEPAAEQPAAEPAAEEPAGKPADEEPEVLEIPGLDFEDDTFNIDDVINEGHEKDTSVTEDEDEAEAEPVPEAEEDEDDAPFDPDEENEGPDLFSKNAENPLVETDPGTVPESEDELLKMIRGGAAGAAAAAAPVPDVTPDDEPDEDVPAAKAVEAEPEGSPALFDMQAEPEAKSEDQDSVDDVLIHYQSSYRVGNDMYDEVFSIDQGDVFRGECGIGIGETLNNTEPKAVTAFEIWLFDKDDIHTSTTYLVSDFGLSNPGISERLLQHGKCDRIRNNGIYILETETLQVEIRVLELEYGTEMEEKNSYFTNVTFDVIARSKTGGSGE